MAPATEELYKNIESAIRDVLNNPSLKITPQSTLFGDLGLESIDLLDLSCDLEKSIGRELDFKAIFKTVTAKRGVEAQKVSIQDVVSYIEASPS